MSICNKTYSFLHYSNCNPLLIKFHDLCGNCLAFSNNWSFDQRKYSNIYDNSNMYDKIHANNIYYNMKELVYILCVTRQTFWNSINTVMRDDYAQRKYIYLLKKHYKLFLFDKLIVRIKLKYRKMLRVRVYEKIYFKWRSKLWVIKTKWICVTTISGILYYIFILILYMLQLY